MSFLRTRIDLQNHFKNVNRGIKALIEMCNEYPDDSPTGFQLPSELEWLSVEHSVIIGYLNDIAKRAKELNDEKLISYVQGLGIDTEGTT